MKIYFLCGCTEKNTEYTRASFQEMLWLKLGTQLHQFISQPSLEGGLADDFTAIADGSLSCTDDYGRVSLGPLWFLPLSVSVELVFCIPCIFLHFQDPSVTMREVPSWRCKSSEGAALGICCSICFCWAIPLHSITVLVLRINRSGLCRSVFVNFSSHIFKDFYVQE